jgi:hypothetical protein
MAEAVTLLTCIQVEANSNLGQDTDNLEGFVVHPHSPHKRKDKTNV